MKLEVGMVIVECRAFPPTAYLIHRIEHRIAVCKIEDYPGVPKVEELKLELDYFNEPDYQFEIASPEAAIAFKQKMIARYQLRRDFKQRDIDEIQHQIDRIAATMTASE